MRTTCELGLKITAAQREYYRYTGPSAEAERRGVGYSPPELAWSHRFRGDSQDANDDIARVTRQNKMQYVANHFPRNIESAGQ